VVVPSVFFGRECVSIGVDKQDRTDELLGSVAVFDSFKEYDRGLVVPTEFFHRDGFAKPR
jgi:hypothetical protein